MVTDMDIISLKAWQSVVLKGSWGGAGLGSFSVTSVDHETPDGASLCIILSWLY